MVPSSTDLIAAVSHPTRCRILRAFIDDPSRCASAEELSRALDEPVAQIGYHLNALSRYEVLRPGQTRRGAGEGPRLSWTLGVEPEWLRLVLDVWLELRAA